MKLSASQAAKAVGVSIPTITRAIKNGVISAERISSGGYRIDASELDRIKANVTHVKGKTLGLEPPITDIALRREIEILREMLERERETVSDLRTRLDSEGEERRRLTSILTHEKPQEPPRVLLDTNVPIGWWKRLWGQ